MPKSFNPDRYTFSMTVSGGLGSCGQGMLTSGGSPVSRRLPTGRCGSWASRGSVRTAWTEPGRGLCVGCAWSTRGRSRRGRFLSLSEEGCCLDWGSRGASTVLAPRKSPFGSFALRERAGRFALPAVALIGARLAGGRGARVHSSHDSIDSCRILIVDFSRIPSVAAVGTRRR